MLASNRESRSRSPAQSRADARLADKVSGYFVSCGRLAAVSRSLLDSLRSPAPSGAGLVRSNWQS